MKLILLFIMTVSLRSLELNQENLARCIVAVGIENREFVFKQIMLESGNLKSGLAVKGNNLTGMRYNKRGFCKGRIYGYASYEKWELCITDYYYYQKKYSLRGYAADKKYIEKINKIKIKKEILAILRL